jgi:hypothetical protein
MPLLTFMLLNRMVEFGDILYYQSEAKKYNEAREDAEAKYGDRLKDGSKF